MSVAKARLLVFALAFVAWLGWLGYQAYSHGRPVVLSRSQLAAAAYPVVAAVEANAEGQPAEKVTVAEVRGTAKDRESLVGKTLTVVNLPNCRVPNGQPFQPGTYLLPLERFGDGFRVAPPPRSPGYEVTARPLIYPWTEEVQKQLAALVGAE
jgi:hypothetical protein